MLDLKAIESYYSEQLRPFKRNILREYLQYKILEIIFNSDAGHKLSFIGGTCLRIAHGLNRFSEDLDFDNLSLGKEEFLELSDDIEKNLELEGYIIEKKSVFKGAYRTYFRFLHLLFDQGLSSHKEERLMIQLDTEPHHYEFKPQIFILNKFDVFTGISVTPVRILLSQKLFAFLNRKRPKARDIYDIIFLFGKTEPDYEYLEEKVRIKDKDMLKKRLQERVSEINLKGLAGEIEPFLIKESDRVKIELFGELIRSF